LTTTVARLVPYYISIKVKGASVSTENFKHHVANTKENVKSAINPSVQVAKHMGSVVQNLVDAMELTNQIRDKLDAAKDAYEKAGGSQAEMSAFISRALHYAIEAGLETSSDVEVRLVPTKLDAIETMTQDFGQTVPFRTQQFSDKADEIADIGGALKTAAMTLGMGIIPRFGDYEEQAAGLQQTLEGLENKL
jgi:ABC-type transporter Mla subunit MlaD